MNSLFEQIDNLLSRLEQTGPITNPDEYEDARASHRVLDALLTTARQDLDAYRQRAYALPDLPPDGIVRWAQAALRMPLAVLVLETTGLEPDADIIRISIRDGAICPLLETFVRPVRYQDSNSYYTGLSLEQVMNAPTFDVIYSALVEALRGRYVIAYGLDFVMRVLNKNIELAGLPSLPSYIGKDLQEQVQLYFHENWPLKLVNACGRIGHLIASPSPSDVRAEAQVRLLYAMSAGITGVAAQHTDIDEHPF